jgi:hypothetical protein
MHTTCDLKYTDGAVHWTAAPVHTARSGEITVHLVIEGRIRGMGIETGCTLVVGTVNSPKSGRRIYSQCNIFEAPDLPDGYYEVFFADQTAFLQRRNACWSVGIPWNHAIRMKRNILSDPAPCHS